MTTTRLPDEENIVVDMVDDRNLVIRIRGSREQADAFAELMRNTFPELAVTVVETSIMTHFLALEGEVSDTMLLLLLAPRMSLLADIHAAVDTGPVI